MLNEKTPQSSLPSTEEMNDKPNGQSHTPSLSTTAAQPLNETKGSSQ